MKRFVSLIIAIIFIFQLSGCSAKSKDGNSKTINIGAIFPLSGDASTYGNSSKNALDMIVDETNKNGGIDDKKIKIIYEDDENDPKTAAAALKKLIKDEKIAAVIGTTSTKGCLAMAQVASSSKLPMIAPTLTNPKPIEESDFIFSASFTDSFQGMVAAKFAAEDLKAKTAGILQNKDDEYSRGLADSFRSNFEKTGGKVIILEEYSTGAQDFALQLTQIKAKSPDVLFIPDYYYSAAIIVKQAKTIGIKSKLLGGDGWDSSDFFKIGGNAVNGSYFSSSFSIADNSQEAVKFINAYKTKYGNEPDSYAALAYDSGKILINAIKKAKKVDGEKIKDAMKQTDMAGVTGPIKFDENREAMKQADILKMEKGKAVFVKKITP